MFLAGGCVFVIGTLVAEVLRKNRVRYDETASGLSVGEYDQSGNLIQELVWLNDIPVATIRLVPAGGGSVGVFYIHTDHLNAPSKITRPTDNVVIWRWDHDPYGNGVPNEDPDGNGLVLNFNLRYPGQYFDSETGLLYNYYRDYDPSTGRYIESDPIGLKGGINTYSYVGGNPITKFDAYGLDPKVDPEDACKLLEKGYKPDNDSCGCQKDVVVELCGCYTKYSFWQIESRAVCTEKAYLKKTQCVSDCDHEGACSGGSHSVLSLFGAT